jgi:hypothetical protein
MQSEQEARDIKRKHSAQLLARPGVCGVGVERDDAGRYVITIHLGTNDSSISSQLPTEIDGYPVKLVHSGPFHKLTS